MPRPRLPSGAPSSFGEFSDVDQLLRFERFAGKQASVEFIKAHPDCEDSEAIEAWAVAAKATTGLDVVIQDPAGLGAIYREQLVAAGFIAEPTWEAQRAWIAATDKGAVMGL